MCALVRNDMLKTEACQRVQERLVRKVRGNMPGVSGGKARGRDKTDAADEGESGDPWPTVLLGHSIAESSA